MGYVIDFKEPGKPGLILREVFWGKKTKEETYGEFLIFVLDALETSRFPKSEIQKLFIQDFYDLWTFNIEGW